MNFLRFIVCLFCYFRMLFEYIFFFFFSSRRRHTRSLRDWSSDVCSSDLLSDEPVLGPRARFGLVSRALALGVPYLGADFRFDPPPLEPFPLPSLAVIGKIGRASCRERV